MKLEVIVCSIVLPCLWGCACIRGAAACDGGLARRLGARALWLAAPHQRRPAPLRDPGLRSPSAGRGGGPQEWRNRRQSLPPQRWHWAWPECSRLHALGWAKWARRVLGLCIGQGVRQTSRQEASRQGGEGGEAARRHWAGGRGATHRCCPVRCTRRGRSAPACPAGRAALRPGQGGQGGKGGVEESIPLPAPGSICWPRRWPRKGSSPLPSHNKEHASPSPYAPCVCRFVSIGPAGRACGSR